MDEKKIAQLKEKLSQKEKEVLKEALMVIYLGDNSDYLNALWDIIRVVIGDDEFYDSEDFNVEGLLRKINPEME